MFAIGFAINHAKLATPGVKAMQIVVLGYTGVIGSALLGAVDMLTLSRRMLRKKGQPEPFEVSTASFDGDPILDGSGRKLDVDNKLGSVGRCDAIIVPGYICDGTNALHLSPEIGAAAAWLRHQHVLGAIVCGSCNGVFLSR